MINSKLKKLFALIPFGIGSFIEEFINKTDTPEGQMSREKLVFFLIKFLIYVVLLWTGIITFS